MRMAQRQSSCGVSLPRRVHKARHATSCFGSARGRAGSKPPFTDSLSVLGVVAALVLAAASPARAASRFADGAAAIAYLNQQRAANGIPPVTDNQILATAWCPNEDNGPSGGELARDLSGASAWSASASPWDSAPLHQFTIYNPEFLEAGDANVSNSACMGLGDIAPQLAAPSFNVYLSDTGPATVPITETVSGEGPLAPQQTVGIPQGRQTGPNILLYARGFPGQQHSQDVNPVTWSLTASGQSVTAIKMADTNTFLAFGLPGGFYDGADMIPPPLQPRTQYQGSVTWQGPDGTMATQVFDFTTGGPLPNHLAIAAIQLDGGRSVLLRVDSLAANETIVARGDGKVLAPRIAHARALLPHLAPGNWTACVTSGGGTTIYRAATRCVRFRISGSRQKRPRRL